MSISVSVTLLSGRGQNVTVSPDATVEELRLQAQVNLKVGLERLVTESGAKQKMFATNIRKLQTYFLFLDIMNIYIYIFIYIYVYYIYIL